MSASRINQPLSKACLRQHLFNLTSQLLQCVEASGWSGAPGKKKIRSRRKQSFGTTWHTLRRPPRSCPEWVSLSPFKVGAALATRESFLFLPPPPSSILPHCSAKAQSFKFIRAAMKNTADNMPRCTLWECPNFVI